MRLTSEAHLSPARRTLDLVRYLPGKRRSWTGWAVFIGLLVLNEMRGAAVAAQVVVGVIKAYHGG